MEILEKQLSSTYAQSIERAKREARIRFNLNPINNVDLICEKIISNQGLEGDIVECGVFSGNTIFPTAIFCNNESIKKEIFGMDTFSGFPSSVINPNDHPSMFKMLLANKQITKDHFDKAKDRTHNFKDTTHLTGEYFLDVNRVFEIKSDFPNVTLVSGMFRKTLPSFHNKISVLYLDCDLYQSYLDVLENLYKHVVESGVIIFDEYYSLKYPGARIAVNEFFHDKPVIFEKYITPEQFERWCVIKH